MIEVEDGTEEGGGEAGDARPSRTEQTRAAAAVNRLGLELTALSPGDLDRLDLPERIREEVDVCQRLKARSRGRQNRLIGQLLRAEDHEAIRLRFESLRQTQRDGVHHEKVNERWLARLLEEGDAGVEALLSEYPPVDPRADRPRLRQLTRTARQDPEAKKTKRARRELLRAIRALRS